jgi:hypothetical protein
VKKTSLYLDPDLDEALARRAADEGLTKAEFIRRALTGALSKPPRVKPEAVALVKDGKASIARDVDAYLASTGFGEWR